MRLHAYWTGRILERCPALAGLAATAAGHHERLDGSGYHRGTRGAALAPEARLLAAADVFAAVTEARPHRPASPEAQAATLLETHVRAGLLDREACAATIEAAGQPQPRSARPHVLTDREIEVLRLTARGLTNRQIAEHLVVSDRTVGHHLPHIYDKTGRRTRAGAAVYAMEHGLLPELRSISWAADRWRPRRQPPAEPVVLLSPTSSKVMSTRLGGHRSRTVRNCSGQFRTLDPHSERSRESGAGEVTRCPIRPHRTPAVPECWRGAGDLRGLRRGPNIGGRQGPRADPRYEASITSRPWRLARTRDARRPRGRWGQVESRAPTRHRRAEEDRS